jgi:AcrR family transcriptional regulator
MSQPALRWGEVAPAGSEEARERLIDAAEVCLARFGLAKTTVEAVARQASVSRATVYRYFESRDELILGVILRDTDRYLTRIRPRMERQESLSEAVIEFVQVTVKAARRDPSLQLLFNAQEASAAAGIIAGSSVALFERVEGFLDPLFERFAGQLVPGVDRAEASEWVLRVILSLLTVEGPRRRTETAQRRLLERFLVPVIARPR